MKGPGNRIDLDVRRIWECPRCHKQRRANGDVVSLRCGCTGDGESMRLVEKQRLVRSFADVVERVQNVSDPDEQPSAEQALKTEQNADEPQPAPTENSSSEAESPP